MIKIIRYIISFTIFSSFLFSNCEKEKPRSEYCKDELPFGFNASAKTLKNNYDLYFEGEALLWQPKEQSLDVAIIDSPNAANSTKILNTHFKYSPGFRLTLGSDFTSEGWDLFLDYTQLKTKNHAEKTVPLSTYFLINTWSLNSNSLNMIKSTWKLDLKNASFNFGRSYFVGKKIIFHPFFSFLGGKINQKMDVFSSNLSADFAEKVSSKSWLIGLGLGIKTNWILERSFSFFCNGKASLFYQYFNFHLNETQSNLLFFSSKHDKKINPSIDLMSGFDWSYSFGKSLSLLFSAGYEMQIFWNQNVMRSFLEELKNKTALSAGNLTPHGFIFALKMSF